MAVRIGPNADPYEIRRVKAAIQQCGVEFTDWSEEESVETLAKRLKSQNIPRVRVIGDVEDGLLQVAAEANIHVCDNPVMADGRMELRHYLREQAVCRTRHRFGNMILD